MRHPAPFSDAVLDRLLVEVDRRFPEDGISSPSILDPFAGTGKGLLAFKRAGYRVTGVDIEPAWATGLVLLGNATNLPSRWTESFDAVVTSPTYGNRMADHHDAKDFSTRHTYKHMLGQDLQPGSSAAMQFGVAYQVLHTMAWVECLRVLRPGGWIMVNVSDHIRKARRIKVVNWHRDVLKAVGFMVEARINIKTPRLGHGQNHAARVPYEVILIGRKPCTT